MRLGHRDGGRPRRERGRAGRQGAFPKGAGFDVRLAGVAVKVIRRPELIARVND